MRVVYLTHTGQLSGAEIGLTRLIAAGEGIEAVTILPEDGPLVDAMERAGARVEILPLPAETIRIRKDSLGRLDAQALVQGARIGRYAQALSRRLGRIGPDLVHTSSLKAGVYGGIAGRLAHKTVIWHLHDRLAPDYLPAPVIPVIRTLIRTLPHAVITPSQMTLDLVGSLPFRKPSAVIPLPVPYPATAATTREVVRTVGLVGRIAPWKGQDVFLEAFARAFPESGIRARVIGAALFGEDAFAASLPARAQALGIADRVDFSGFQKDAAGGLSELDIVVHCSVSADPLATVVLEGLAAGVPVVSADAGGTAEFLRDREDVMMHTPGDAESLAGALRQLSTDDALRARLAQAGRVTALRFTPARAAGEMEAFYRHVLARRAGRAHVAAG